MVSRRDIFIAHLPYWPRFECGCRRESNAFCGWMDTGFLNESRAPRFFSLPRYPA